jgi:hypothetical protein
VVTTTKFDDLARREAAEAGLEDARIAVVAHPIGGTPSDELARRGDAAADVILALLEA